LGRGKERERVIEEVVGGFDIVAHTSSDMLGCGGGGKAMLPIRGGCGGGAQALSIREPSRHRGKRESSCSYGRASRLAENLIKAESIGGTASRDGGGILRPTRREQAKLEVKVVTQGLYSSKEPPKNIDWRQHL